MDAEAVNLLRRIRSLVDDVERLEQAGASDDDLKLRGREIARLQWQLATVVSRHAAA